MIYRYLLAITLLLFFNSCSNDEDPPNDIIVNEEVVFSKAFPSLSFNRPIFLTDAGDGSNQLYVAEQSGKILSFENSGTTSDFKTFLNIEEQVNSAGNEQGLLGIAFHPNYSTNGRFYINYIGSDDHTIISELVAEVTNNSASSASEKILLEFDQPFQNHNGGMMAFGPDNYLYIATGDGGSGGDPLNNAQNRGNLLGKILRIDVDASTVNNSYGIPRDNPFVNNTEGVREEIYAYGLRNPWRFSFDNQSGDLWLADVGQNQTEEINLVISGGNYGWNIVEGSDCFESSNCDMADLQMPVAEYGHDLGISITGGYVYRGSAFPEFQGHYFYGDFGTGRIWTLDTSTPDANPELFANTDFNISSFGQDQTNELFLLNFADGAIYTLNIN